MLAMLTAGLLEKKCDKQIVEIAVAVEMLHTATLIHDDVADDSDMRRNMPTAKSVFGNTAAVLVGDFWLAKVIQNIVNHPDRRVISVFAQGLRNLAEGEILQIEKAAALDTTEEDYYKIIYKKTASLFEAAMSASAYSCGADSTQCEAVRQYAYHYGMAFQIMDDIFDYSPGLHTGKPSGQDVMEKKITLPLLGFFRNAPAGVVSDFIARMRELPSTLAAEATELVNKYAGIEYSVQCLRRESDAAVNALEAFPDSQSKDFLISLAAASRLS